MGTGLLVVAVVVAALACPAMMLWQRRRGRAAACCLPSRDDGGEREVEELRRDQATLSARLAALQEDRAELQVTGQGKDG